MTLHHLTREAVERAGLVDAYVNDAHTCASVRLLDSLVQGLENACARERIPVERARRIIGATLAYALPDKEEADARVHALAEEVERLRAQPFDARAVGVRA